MCIQDKGLKACLDALRNIEMAEIRLDLTQLTAEETSNLFKSANVPLIATCRYDSISDQDRMILLKAAIAGGAAFVDLEIEANEQFKSEMKSFAKKHNCNIIISYHNYKETASKETLQILIDQCFREGANIAKIATMVNTEQDAARLLGLYEKNKNLIALGMGEKGKITRVAALKLGAPFTFAAKDSLSATAPGQLTLNEFETIYSLL
ncbi:MAG: type I 3-dehydroquinate dehydratase [Bacteroidales bacterium]|nr:type I 3-dehydroquinate dehydratase [Bacteroidales bacterium]